MLLKEFAELAYRAHTGTSFSPEKRANQYITDYTADLEKHLTMLDNLGQKYGVSTAEIESIKERFIERYKRHFSAWLGAKSNCISVMIAGPSKFPVRRAEKANNAERAKSDFFHEWPGRFLKAVERGFKPKVTVLFELEAARKNLSDREHLQDLMKKANAIIRKAKGNDCTAQLIEAGIKQALAVELQNGEGKWYGTGFAPFELTNNNAEIKRLRTRVTQLEMKESMQAEENKEYTINGVRMVYNYQIDRIQLIFEGKPAKEIRETLGKHAFRWSPKEVAWQRKITKNAEDAAKRILFDLS